jgi:cytidine deaminase
MGKTISIVSELTVYSSQHDMSEEAQQLIQAAKASAFKAYSPYSQFQVGAAVLLDNGKMIPGNNQENACYPAGLCAERVAFFAAKSQYPDAQVLSIAVVAKRADEETFREAAPCGSCRQVMSEYEVQQKKDITLYMMGPDGTIQESSSIGNLLPFTFTSESLGNS